MSNQRENFASLFQGCQQDLLRYILGCVPSHSDAMDILQETASALWQKIDEYDADMPFGPWARKFAHMQVLKFCLYKKRERQNLTAYSEQTQKALAEEYEQHVDVLGLRSGALSHCMEQLTSGDRQLLQQRYFQKTTMRDVAQQLGKNEDQVYRRLNRIRKALMNCIDRRVADMGLA